MKASTTKHVLRFKRPSGTSRGVMHQKETWFLTIRDGDQCGIGECSPLFGLGIDNEDAYEDRLQWVCRNVQHGPNEVYAGLVNFPSIRFGVEQALRSLAASDPFALYPSDFSRGKAQIPINGLVWMGDHDFMLHQVKEKINAGFTCIKLKIGALDFEKELAILGYIRERYDRKDVEIRVDANGAFAPEEALGKLERLAAYDLHSIEQPIKAGQGPAMAQLRARSPLPIALDEELIGNFSAEQKEAIVKQIRPHYLILKPSLLGGFAAAEEWIRLARQEGIGWWVTSALESNIGLNSIAQWTYTLKAHMPQGLGTGSLFTNNVEGPLTVKNGYLYTDKNKSWDTGTIAGLCI